MMSMDWFKVTEWGSPMDWGVALGLDTKAIEVEVVLRPRDGANDSKIHS